MYAGLADVWTVGSVLLIFGIQEFIHPMSGASMDINISATEIAAL
jgi:hypothetical protein